jgi:thioredoxin-dependent peroxiredoxin
MVTRLHGRRSLLAIPLLALGAGAPLARAAEPVPTQNPAPAPSPIPDLLPVGTPAPEFTAVAHDGQKIDLAKLKGKNVALYFYPKDDTPGCTKEACDFRDSWSRLQKAGVVVLGVSTQDAVSHRAFAEKYKLPFALIPDDKGELAARYKVPVVGGNARRITYLIGKDGKIKHVWPKVTPVGHAAEILAAVEAK